MHLGKKLRLRSFVQFNLGMRGGGGGGVANLAPRDR